MKTETFRTFVFVLILAFATTACAGYFSKLSFIGFSNSGRYLAFEEYGTQDGSGFPFSTIYFIDTTKNVFAAPVTKVVVEDEMGLESTARARSAALAAKKLKQFGIVRGNTGNIVVSHQLTDLTFQGDVGAKAETSVKFAEEMWSMHQEGEYELVLNPIKVTTKDCEPYGYDIFMMELKLTDKMGDGKTKFLQKDTSLPASRGCVMSYRIQDVYLYKGTIAVFMSFNTPGFEGPDMRFMAATGKLK